MKKRFALPLMLLVALVMGTTSASAATMKATGQWQVDAMMGSMDFRDDAKDNAFTVGQRMRTKFEFIANENLKGVLETQIGTNSWGNGLYQVGSGRSPSATAGGALSAGSGNIIMRKGYLDFKWPNTKVNFLVGYQSLALPSAFGAGSAILDDHVAGAAAVVPITDGVTLVGGYARPLDVNTFGTTGVNRNGTSADVAFMYADLDYTGFKVQPFAAYAYSGQAATLQGGTALAGMIAPSMGSYGSGVRAYWAGAAVTVTALNSFKIMGDLNYGKATNNTDTLQKSGRSGWLADVAVDYTGLSMMTPEVFAAYSTGENSDNLKSGRMPSLSAENWAYGTFWMQGGDSLGGNITAPTTNLGFWAVGLSLKDIKLVDKLSHTFNLIYFKGTNDHDMLTSSLNNGLVNGSVAYGRTLTDKDSLVEIDLNSKYQIYEELSLGLELGYINANFDKSVWATALGANSSDLSKDAYKANLMLNYSF